MNKSALQTSVKLLSKKDYSSSKLEISLLKKGFSIQEIEDAIIKLKEKNYINDERYAENRAIVLLKNKYANKYIILKLETENLVIEESSLNSLREEYNLEEIDVLKQLVRDKARIAPMEDSQKNLTRNLRYLSSRGFKQDQIIEVLGVESDTWN